MTRNDLTHRAARAATGAILLASGWAATGCNAVGAVLYKTVGSLPVEARYVPEQVPMLVLVERYNQSSGGTSIVDTEVLTREVSKQIARHEIAPQVDATTALDLRSQDPAAFSKLTISQIGGKLGASQVLYVNVLQSEVQSPEGSSMVRGTMAARVKVIDVASGRTLFPVDLANGYPVSVETSPQNVRAGTTPESVRGLMARQLAEQIGRLFRKYQPDTDGTP